MQYGTDDWENVAEIVQFFWEGMKDCRKMLVTQQIFSFLMLVKNSIIW